MKTSRTVYVVNQSAHDFRAARRYGRLRYLSRGRQDPYAANSMHRDFEEILSKSLPEDFILLCGLPVQSCVACAIFARIHKRLNLLLYRDGRYIERTILLGESLDD